MTHTDPFPSRVRTGSNGEEIFIASKDDGSVLATMTGNDLFHLDLANLFVTSHNSHDGLLEALEEEGKFIRKCQDVLTSYLVPDGIDADEAISNLLGLLDGPEQRAIQKKSIVAIKAARP